MIINAKYSTLLTLFVHKVVLKMQKANLGMHKASFNVAGTIEVFHTRVVQAILKLVQPSFIIVQQMVD